jgi:hypothetical protein
VQNRTVSPNALFRSMSVVWTRSNTMRWTTAWAFCARAARLTAPAAAALARPAANQCTGGRDSRGRWGERPDGQRGGGSVDPSTSGWARRRGLGRGGGRAPHDGDAGDVGGHSNGRARG